MEGTVQVSPDGLRLHAAVRNGSGLGTEAVCAVDHAGILVDDVAVLRPSLDDVFFALTGRPSGEPGAGKWQPESARSVI